MVENGGRPDDGTVAGPEDGDGRGERDGTGGVESWPAGWTEWSVSQRRVVLAYRPDVFDGDAFPPPCLPTIYVTKGRRRRQPGDRTRPDDPWFVTLYLEPEVSRDADRYDTRETAVGGARDLAARFATGEVDYRARYQVPRDRYLDRLDELTGPDGCEGGDRGP